MMERQAPLTFGELLRRYRVAAVLTQQELAARAGLSTRAVSDLERGVKGQPHPDTVRRLATALGLDGTVRRSFEAARRRQAGRRSEGTVASSAGGDQSELGTQAVPLVGRVREQALLEHHLSGEGPPVLLLAGEPGIGKSRLLRVAAERAARAGWCVLQAGCQRRSGQEPFAPVLGAFNAYIRQRPEEALRADLRGCAWLVRLLPELADGPIERLAGWVLPPEQERRLMMEAAERFTANIAGPAGTVLLLDDLQWAGADALDMLATLVRSTEGPPRRVIGAYRDTELAAHHALAVLLADLAHAGLAWQRSLAPLTPEEAGQLLDQLLAGTGVSSTAVREQVVRLAGGVPFYLVSYAQGVRRDTGESGAPLTVPWDLAQGIRQRVAALAEGARQVVGLAAVIGRVVPRTLVLAAAAQPAAEVSVALDAAQRARLLEPEGADTYRFVHDVIHEVVATDLGAAHRALLHRRIAEVLESQGGAAVELLGYHYDRAGASEKAALYLEQAGDRAWAQHATVAAEGYYRDAVERRDRLGKTHESARVREKLGLVLLTTAHHDAALQALEEAAATYRTAHDDESLGRVTARIGRVHESRGTPAEGVQRVQPLVERLEACGPSPGLVTLYARLADLLWACGRYRAQRAAAQRAIDLARQVGDDHSLAEALWEHGIAQLTAGHLAEARSALEEAVPRAEAVGALDSHIEPLLLLSVIFLRYGAVEHSRLTCTRALSLAERSCFSEYVTAATARLAIISFVLGDWAQACRYGEEALALSRSLGPS
jgi:transcriptional regulator with XRE-family HTH domain/tetratricopeptide (TPR) repeat protein